MRIQFNRKLLLQTVSMVLAVGGILISTQGCVPSPPACAPNCPKGIQITATPSGNTAETAFQGSGQVTIETPNALASEADLFFSIGTGADADTSCADVYDYSAIEILDDVKIKVAAVSESPTLLDRNAAYSFYVDNPSYPNAALKDKWLVDEKDIFEKFFLCTPGFPPWDNNGPDPVTGRCTYPNFTTVTPLEASEFIFNDMWIAASCENIGSGFVQFDYDVEPLLAGSDNTGELPKLPNGNIDLSKFDVLLTISYDNCEVNGTTYDGESLFYADAFNIATADIYIQASSAITVDGDVSGTFNEEGRRRFKFTLKELIGKRWGTYTVDCSTGGCATGPVTWTAEQGSGQYWFEDPRMVNGCPTSNVEPND